MKSILVLCWLIFICVNSYSQNIDKIKPFYSEKHRFSGSDTVLIEFDNIVNNSMRHVVYFQVYFKNNWTTIDSLIIDNKTNKKKWGINKSYLANMKLKSRFKFRGIDKKHLKSIKRITKKKVSKIEVGSIEK